MGMKRKTENIFRREVNPMSSTAIVFNILPGMTPQMIEFSKEAIEPRLSEHDLSRKDLGITVEKAFIESTNQGDVVIFYFEGEDLERSFKKMGESKNEFDIWFREKMYALTGTDLRDSSVFEPAKLVFASPVYEPETPVNFTATIFPVLSGMEEKWMLLLSELSGPRDEEYRGYLWRYGITLEKIFLQTTHLGEMAILYMEGDDPPGAISRFARSHHPFDVWYREEMLYLNGVDFIRRQTAPHPYLILDWNSGTKVKAA